MLYEHTLKTNFILRVVTLAVVFTMAGVPSAYAAQPDIVKLTVNLPQDISETNFNNNTPYQGDIDGNPFSFTGVPFLKDNTTYLPVRDIANIFGIGINYNLGDRHIQLLTADGMIVISPFISFSKRGSVMIQSSGFVPAEQQYLLVNNRSYLPIRYIMETIGCEVKYDISNHKIEINGVKTVPAKENSFITVDQKKIIDALSSYEGAFKVLVEGNIKLDGRLQALKSEITRASDNNTISESCDIISGNTHFRAKREMFLQNGAQSFSLVEILKNKTEKQINLIGWGSNHPYNLLGDTGLSGIQKYYSLEIKNMGETSGIQNFEVLVQGNSGKYFEIGIDKTSKKLRTYSSKLSDGSIEKDISIVY